MHHNPTRFEVETLCRRIFRGASNNHSHSWNKLSTIYRRIDRSAHAWNSPANFENWLFEISHVPNLETLASSATSRDNCPWVGVHVNTVTTSLRLAYSVGFLLSPYVPEFHCGVPTTGVNLVGTSLTEFCWEDFVGVSPRLAPNDLNRLHSLFVVNFNLWQQTGNSKPLAVICVVNALVLIAAVESNFFALVVHFRAPAQHAAVAHRA